MVMFLHVMNSSCTEHQWLILDQMSNVKAHVQAQKLLGAHAVLQGSNVNSNTNHVYMYIGGPCQKNQCNGLMVMFDGNECIIM